MNFLNKKIFNYQDRFFSIDLSDLSVKMVELEKYGKLDRIRSFCSVDIPRGYIEDGNIIEKEKVVDIIKKAKRSAGPKRINTKKVICSLPESKAFLRIVSIPKMEREEASEAIKWEIEASIPLLVDQVYFDWQFLNEHDGKQDVLTVAVSKDVVDDLMDTMARAGLEVYGLELESVASARSLIRRESGLEEISLIVDLGAKKTSFIITQGNVPCFTSSIPFSCDGINDILIKDTGVTWQEAEKIKVSSGMEYFNENSSISGSIFPLLENLVREIERSIDFYQSISKDTHVEKIIICGGGANLKGLSPYLVKKLSKEIYIGDPWINLNFGDTLPIINKENSTSYTTAVGLALRKINLWR